MKSVRSRLFQPILLLLLVIAVIGGKILPVNANGPWANGQNASLALGQPDLTSNAFTATPSASVMGFPYDVAVDPTTGKVFVVDYGNNRVMRFASGASLSSGAAAEAILGQPNAAAHASATTATGMDSPSALFIDSGGHLWVSDTGNNRILRFDNASSRATGAAADGVLGAPDFTTKIITLAAAQFFWGPRGLAVDSAGHLWVAIQGEHRVLRFDNAAGKANGAAADGVLGQATFTGSLVNRNGAASAVANGMYYPTGVAISSGGALYVADGNNQRVLRFNNAAAKANGANADGVLGEPDFTTSAFATSQTGFHLAWDVAVDAADRLYVTDQQNNRVLIFDNADTSANGAPASTVLGQTDFTSWMGGNGASGLYNPVGVAVDPLMNAIWVVDQFNYRVLRYAPPLINTSTALASSANPSGSGQSVTITATVSKTSGGGTPTGSVTFQDGGLDIPGCIAVSLNGLAKAACTTSALSVAAHHITAVYAGDSTFNGSTSAELVQTVQTQMRVYLALLMRPAAAP